MHQHLSPVQAAARLYEAAGDHQAATALYIRAQRFEDASRLISDTGLQEHKLGLARAREGACAVCRQKLTL